MEKSRAILGPLRSGLALRAVRLTADTACAPRPQNGTPAGTLTASAEHASVGCRRVGARRVAPS
jgi:hypothetical protein